MEGLNNGSKALASDAKPNALEDAIKEQEELARFYENLAPQREDDFAKAIDLQCAAGHRQVAVWLRELKILRDIIKNVADLIKEEPDERGREDQ